EGGIGYWSVTGVQACALPIYSGCGVCGSTRTSHPPRRRRGARAAANAAPGVRQVRAVAPADATVVLRAGLAAGGGVPDAQPPARSEEGRVGGEGGSGCGAAVL